jgi:hypothetical protein
MHKFLGWFLLLYVCSCGGHGYFLKNDLVFSIFFNITSYWLVMLIDFSNITLINISFVVEFYCLQEFLLQQPIFHYCNKCDFYL